MQSSQTESRHEHYPRDTELFKLIRSKVRTQRIFMISTPVAKLHFSFSFEIRIQLPWSNAMSASRVFNCWYPWIPTAHPKRYEKTPKARLVQQDLEAYTTRTSWLWINTLPACFQTSINKDILNSRTLQVSILELACNSLYDASGVNNGSWKIWENMSSAWWRTWTAEIVLGLSELVVFWN